ncbi:hypothetical protein A2707_02855 [Candidatus Saccharibacteria bacterium RIFCSPHIGHO2_01_FULL_45_15]|nr:MAG: hypothetical protein A2707_02855 [Candidatus Saccharibacteria bacterium RIFCSPHIGHO2_01_FULL_45_15]OGL27054.1 MAG: hypothetical protein A3C39_00705 [Candidatus Saccharibacteria bacterium RIFCSPHIGHO2_02_FULL_46_12]OGL31865.1 MAG: hypothetical protein A3E76_03450 [Candidatus Saccharibacteria bacterium RIFCSPHIGHO2_12_FULL_44_22]
MQTGEYIIDRWLPKIVRQIASDIGCTLRTYSDDWVIELESTDTVRRIIGYKFDINNSVASMIASDKVAAYQILRANDVAAVEHTLLRTKVGVGGASFNDNWQDIVVKPLAGTSGHGVRRLKSRQSAEEWIEQSGIEAWAVSPYYNIQQEIRLIVLDDKVLLSYEKLPIPSSELLMFNLGKGAVPRNIVPDSAIVKLALSARQALGLHLAAVDIIILQDGQSMVLEVNDGIMMEHYARVSEQNYATARRVYGDIMRIMMAE